MSSVTVGPGSANLLGTGYNVSNQDHGFSLTGNTGQQQPTLSTPIVHGQTNATSNLSITPSSPNTVNTSYASQNENQANLLVSRENRLAEDPRQRAYTAVSDSDTSFGFQSGPGDYTYAHLRQTVAQGENGRVSAEVIHQSSNGADTVSGRFDGSVTAGPVTANGSVETTLHTENPAVFAETTTLRGGVTVDGGDVSAYGRIEHRDRDGEAGDTTQVTVGARVESGSSSLSADYSAVTSDDVPGGTLTVTAETNVGDARAFVQYQNTTGATPEERVNAGFVWQH
jgi:hypothetical protein